MGTSHSLVVYIIMQHSIIIGGSIHIRKSFFVIYVVLNYNNKNSPLHYNHAFYFPLNMMYSGGISISL